MPMMPRWWSWLVGGMAVQLFAGALLVNGLAVHARAQTAVDVQTAITADRVIALDKRVSSLESAGFDSRVSVLALKVESLQNDALELRRLAYGIIGGVGTQLILMFLQLRARRQERDRYVRPRTDR